MTSPLDIPLRCRCGQVRGVARAMSPTAGMRLVCYCRDCQAFARYLGHPEGLDDAGGTDIVQLPVGRLRLTEGAGAVRCVSFSRQLLRWYAGCCDTPIANAAHRFPVVGLICGFIDPAVDDPARDAALGRPICRVFPDDAIGPLPAGAPPPASAGVFPLRLWRLLTWLAQGLGRPNPFFDAHSNPIAAPRRLTPDERAALDPPKP